MPSKDAGRDEHDNIITIADNHPVYVNGTKLVNGMPIIDDNHKDFSRLEEFQNAGFSKDYIQWLTDPQYPRASPGKPINYGTSLPYKPAYSKIGNETILYDPDNCDMLHKIEIIDNSVLFNGVIIASAPEKHGSGKKVTKNEKLTFCRAVVWSIIPGTIMRHVKNQHGNMEYVTVPDDEYLRELIAKYPADVPEKEPEITLDNIVENITMTPYPGPGVVEEIEYTEAYAYRQDLKDLSKLLHEELSDMDHDEIWNNVSLNQENNPETADEIINAFCTNVMPVGWIPHLRLSIQEVPA